jgi:hypothetical protein
LAGVPARTNVTAVVRSRSWRVPTRDVSDESEKGQEDAMREQGNGRLSGPMAGAVVAMVLATAGCGGDQPDTDAAPASPAASAAPSSALKTNENGIPVDICGLVDKSLVESTLKITVATVEPSSVGCELKTADYAKGGGSYDFDVYPWDNGGSSSYAFLAGGTGNADYHKVDGPWDEAVYYKSKGGALILVFKTPKWAVSTSVAGSKLTLNTGDLSPQMATLATALAKSLQG